MTRSFKTNVAVTGDLSTTGQLNVTASSGDEGGQIYLANAVTNTTISTGVNIDVYQNKLRFWEAGGTNRGYYVDITSGGAGVGTSLTGGSTGAMNYAQTVGTKQSAISTAGTTIVSVSITTNGYPIQVSVTGDMENNSAGGWVVLQLYRGSTAIGNPVHAESSAGSENVPYALSVIDAPSAGTYTYALKINNSAGGTFNFGESNGPVITAVELSGPKGDTGAAGTSPNAFTTIATPSGTNPVADNTADTLTFTAAGGLSITGDSTTDTIAFSTNASSSNGASTLVIRDASGNFTANTVTASLTGTAANATNTTITNDAITATAVYPTWVTANSGNLPLKTTSGSLSFVPSTGILTASGFTSTVATGTAPFTVASTTMVTNLNADMLEGYSPATANTINSIVLRDASGNFAAGTITAATFSGSGASLTNIPGANVTGTLTSTVLGNSTVYIGNTAVALNRAQGNLGLTGISSVTFAGSTSGTVILQAPAAAGAGATLSLPTTAGTLALTTDIPTVNDATLTVAVSGTGLSISATPTFTSNQSTNRTITITSNATNANTVSAIVARDASGNFSAGTITASLTGTASNATNVTITNDAATATSVYPTWVTANTGNLPAKTTSAALSFVPSTGTLTATAFSGSGVSLTNVPTSSSRNYILNSAFDIAQRGSTPAVTGTYLVTGAGYTLDQWYVQVPGNTTVGQTVTGTVSQIAGTANMLSGGPELQYYANLATSISGGSAQSTATYFGQRVEDVRTLAGQTVTLTFWAKAAANTSSFVSVIEQNFGSGGSASVTNTSSAISLTTSWAKFTYTVTLGTMASKTIGTSSYLDVRPLQLPAGSFTATTVSIAAVKLEIGSVSNTYTRLGASLAEELLACQRYFYRFDATNTTTYAYGYISSATSARLNFPVPVKMRAAPTLSSDGTEIVRNYTATAQTVSSVSTIESTLPGQITVVYVMSAATVGVSVLTSVGNMDFSAEI